MFNGGRNVSRIEMFLQKIIIIIYLIDVCNAELFYARSADINKFDDAAINDLVLRQIVPNLLYIFVDCFLPSFLD